MAQPLMTFLDAVCMSWFVGLNVLNLALWWFFITWLIDLFLSFMFQSFPLFALMQKVEQKDQGHSTAPHEWPASARQQSLDFGASLR
jgi:hypothetical protein